MPRRKCKYRWLPMVIVYTAETWHHRIALEVVLVKVEYLHAGRWLWVHHLPNSPCIPLCPKHILAERRPKIPSTRALLNPRSPSPSRPAVPLPPAASPPGQGRSKVGRTLPTPAVGGRSSPGHSRLAVSSAHKPGTLRTMWKEVLLVGFASVVLQAPQAQSAAESVPFPGYLPGENVRAKAPEGDGGPNDIYAHLPVRRPELDDDQVVIYPHSLVFEYGQDPEHHIYEVHSAKELANLAHSKHDKHGKHAHDHHHHDKGTKEAAAKGTPKNLKPAPPRGSHEQNPELPILSFRHVPISSSAGVILRYPSPVLECDALTMPFARNSILAQTPYPRLPPSACHIVTPSLPSQVLYPRVLPLTPSNG
ncbi:hypothetical protein C7M84_008394 [Penaeus vannamei]|uniref:Uncharacterized protein n=1 Tax=Penaeus vannamei TaxID=6689 RepID=A0A3R7M553_PENVA|nr:hypothetical protein C7M84_008394 [Penaeus vannamei]